MIRKINHFSLYRSIPTIDDTESLTVLELVGRNTSKVNEIVETLNTFISNMEKEINNGIDIQIMNHEEFKKYITDLIHNYIMALDLKVDDAYNYMKTNLEESLNKIFSEEDVLNLMNNLETRVSNIENRLNIVYDENTESLNVLGGV